MIKVYDESCSCAIFGRMDILSKADRSRRMSLIRNKNTKPELLVRRFLHKEGYRFRVHDSTLPGKPDIKLPKYKTVVFVHGCYWHGHQGCKYHVLPQSNQEFWEEKISRNRMNDADHVLKLEKADWKVIVIWECELKKRNQQSTLKLLKTTLGRF